jgi:hypothetical protein
MACSTRSRPRLRPTPLATVSALLGDVELIELFMPHHSPLFVAVRVPGSWSAGAAGAGLAGCWCLRSRWRHAAAGRASVGAPSTALRDTTAEVTAHAVDSVQGLRTIAAFDWPAARRRGGRAQPRIGRAETLPGRCPERAIEAVDTGTLPY